MRKPTGAQMPRSVTAEASHVASARNNREKNNGTHKRKMFEGLFSGKRVRTRSKPTTHTTFPSLPVARRSSVIVTPLLPPRQLEQTCCQSSLHTGLQPIPQLSLVEKLSLGRCTRHVRTNNCCQLALPSSSGQQARTFEDFKLGPNPTYRIDALELLEKESIVSEEVVTRKRD